MKLQHRRATGRKNEAGYVVVTAALSLFVLLGFLGLAIDVGQMRLAKRKLQNAADAAAIAGGAEILFGDLTVAAKAASAANGFTHGTNGVTVTVNNPPASGPHSGDAHYVEAIVSQNQSTMFMGALGVTTVPLSARAVASGTSPNCIYALAPGTNSLNLTISIVTSACGVIGDGNVGGFLAALNASSIGVAGNNSCFFCFFNPSLQTHIAPATDPLASLPAPSVDTTCTGVGSHNGQVVVNGTTTLSPGTYCGGINIVAPSGVVTFNPGVYVMYGGGFQMAGAFGGAVTGSGVTIYNTGTASGPHAYGPITTWFTGGSSLVAPTSGTYAGILLFQDRNNPQTASFNANFGFGSRPFLQGAYYFSDAEVDFNFDFGQSAAYTILVANKVSWLVNFTFNNDLSSLPGGQSPIKNTGALAE